MSADPARPAPPDPAGNEVGLAKGATIGRYVVLGLLGRGGMGEVYAAYDPELDRKIAVKLLRARGGAATADGAHAPAARGAGDRAAVAPERRRRLRRRHVRGLGVHRDGVRRGAHARLLAAGEAAHLARGAGRLPGRRPRPGRGARRRARPPRLQARQRDDHRRPGRCASWTSASRARRRATTQPSPAQQQALDAAARAAALAGPRRPAPIPTRPEARARAPATRRVPCRSRAATCGSS